MFRFCFTADIILLLFGCYSVDNPTKELSAIEDCIEILSDPDGEFKNITYGISTKDTVVKRWLLQMPSVLGQRPSTILLLSLWVRDL